MKIQIITPIEIYETGINPYAVVLFNIMYLGGSRNPNKHTKAKNEEFAKLLKWEIKSVKKYLQLLKSLYLIVISEALGIDQLHAMNQAEVKMVS